jgi:hypothetical protein
MTTRAKEARTTEVTETHVTRAKDTLAPKPEPAVRRRTLTKAEAALVTVYSLLLSAVGVIANHLGHAIGVVSFVTALLGVALCAYIAWKKRIL